LFDEAEDLIEVEETEPEIQTDASSAQLTKASTVKIGRKPLSADLPRVRIEYDLPESERHCRCGCQRTLIGEETSEQLDIIPSSVRVLIHVLKKYACKACEEGINIAPQPIPKSMASPGLLAYIATAKYQDGFPLYRLEATFKRMHIDLGRNTQARWMIAQICYSRSTTFLKSGCYQVLTSTVTKRWYRFSKSPIKHHKVALTCGFELAA